MCRLIAKANSVRFTEVSFRNCKKFKQVIETYFEFPRLKFLESDETNFKLEPSLEIAKLILAKSQVEEFVTIHDHNETDLLKLLAK